jgi:hypothetical protein
MEAEFLFIGWCNKVDPDGSKHDKVWTAFRAGENYYAGWCARGKKPSFKNHGSGWAGKRSLGAVQTKKRAPKGEYEEVDTFRLFVLFPTFKEDVEKWLTFDTLANKVR